MLLQASQPDPIQSAEALASVVRSYENALRIHLIRRYRMSEDEASDCLQSFIHQKVLVKGLLGRADRKRGRFRNFLLTSLDRFAISENRRQLSQRRNPESQVPFDDLTENEVPGTDEPPVLEFDVAWAKALLAETVANMKSDCERRGLEAVWGVFELRLLRPLLEGSDPAGYGDLVARFQLESPTQAFNALITGKRLFARHLRVVVGKYARTEQEIETEIGELRAILERA